MTTASKSAIKSTSKQKETANAIDLLTQDHKNVKKLFKEFEKFAKNEDTSAKVEVANKICEELTVHAQIEEEIFYPAARKAIKDDDMLNEALVEHSTAKDLIAQIQDAKGDDDMYDAKVKVLSEYINHHVKEEEEEMFEKAKKSKMDLEDLGVQLLKRKEELTK